MTKTGWLALPALMAFIAYAPVLKLGFLAEDHAAIEVNPQLRGWTAEHLRHDWTHDVLNIPQEHYYRPLLTVLNRVRFSLWELRPLGYRVSGLALHAACATLGALLILELTGSLAIGVLTGCLFAVHPIGVHTQLVVMAQEEPLSFLLSLLALLWGRREGPLPLAGMVGAYALALFAKESAVVVPWLLALLLWVERRPRATYVRPAILIALTVPYLYLRAYATGPIPLPLTPRLAFILLGKVFPTLWWLYLKLLVWPAGLHYPCLMPAHAPFWALALATWLGLGVYAARLSRLAFAGWAWFTLWLAPHLPSIMTLDSMMNHWAYPGSLAFFTALAWGLHRGRRRFALTGAFVALPLAVWTGFTWATIADSATDVQFHARTLRYEPTLDYAQANLGYALLHAGRPAEARLYLLLYLKTHPADAQARRALAAIGG